jgi:transketolase
MPSRRQLANAIRALSMDAVQQANSGHPGAPMGMADIAEVLWRDVLYHNPANSDWANRDRFVLSNGHGSMLLYSLLHLTGYALDISELRNFRQLGSKTPGHPEYRDTPGVETTTGPLGQGFANGVGMALAEKMLAAQFNRSETGRSFHIVDHHTYVFLGDGCLMEGISHEVASLAGTLGLGKLICIYDDNGISIDGEVQGWFADNTARRFEAYGWQVVEDVDGHDPEAVHQALMAAKAETHKPSLICCKTTIGFGSPSKAGTAGVHGSPLGEDEVAATRRALGWEHDPFEIPQDVYEEWNCRARGEKFENEWRQSFAEYQQQYPQLAQEYERRMAHELPDNWHKEMANFITSTQADGPAVASRKASQQAIEKIASLLPELVGGSADLTGSNLTNWPQCQPLTREDASGNYVYFGVREFGMTAIMNGVALHGGFLPFSGTFLVFMEYARNAVRMSALMGLQNIFVYTHDSIGQGEDGPTHQPIEQISNLRATPNMSVWRPCDATEAMVSWKAAVERHQGPTSLVFSRQSLPHQERTAEQVGLIARGAYILKDCPGAPEVVVIATGSEVAVAAAAVDQLQTRGLAVRLVSMASADVFENQDLAYKNSVLPSDVTKRLAVEAAQADYWYKWVGLEGRIIGMNSFGASAPGGELFAQYGFTADTVIAEVEALVGGD